MAQMLAEQTCQDAAPVGMEGAGHVEALGGGDRL